jgi:hypothetical protein
MDVRSVLMLGIAQRVHDIHFERLETLYPIMEKYFDENGKFDLIEYREEYGNWFLKEEIYPKVAKFQEDVMKDFVTGYDFRTALREESNRFIATDYYPAFIKIMEEIV